jgi:purine-binding chemotaxis protein CheW
MSEASEASEASTASRAEELRRAFDGGFARPPGAGARDTEEILAIRIGADPYALRLAELAGLHAGKAITPLPGDVPGLLGIGGFRGALVPVYDLRALLGLGGLGGGGGGAIGAAAPRWLVIAAAAPVALAFDGLDAFTRVPRDAVAVHDGAAPGHVRHAVRTPDGMRPIVDIPSMLDAIRARARPRKE